MDRLISAPESLAQSVLVALCDDSRIQTRALRYLEELERYAAATTTTPSSSKRTKRDERLNGGVTRANPRKRKAAAAAAAATTVEPAQICLQCKRAFTPSGNSAEACLYHHGELVRDGTHSVWEGRDEVTSSPRPCDSLESREEFPDAFVWSGTPPPSLSFHPKLNFFFHQYALLLTFFFLHLLPQPQHAVTEMVHKLDVPKGIMSPLEKIP